jgi:hypothetical protein
MEGEVCKRPIDGNFLFVYKSYKRKDEGESMNLNI